jgi:DNA-binding transcriptional MerR regulator
VSPNPDGPAAVLQRRERAIRLRNQGVQWSQIATELGYSDKAAACKDVSRALKERREQLALAVDEHREQALAHLDDMAAAVWAVLKARHQTIQNGKVVRDNGEPVLDDGPVLSAVDRLLRIEERRARLLGIDAPSQVTGTIVNYTVDGVPPDALT